MHFGGNGLKPRVIGPEGGLRGNLAVCPAYLDDTGIGAYF